MAHGPQSADLPYSPRANDEAVPVLVHRPLLRTHMSILVAQNPLAHKNSPVIVRFARRHEHLHLQCEIADASSRLDVETLVRTMCVLPRTFNPADQSTFTRRHLGGELPTSLEVRCPTLDARLKIDIPPNDIGEHVAFSVFDPANAVGLCKRVLRKAEDYDEAVGRAIEDGATLELAWRMDTRLDWVWQSEDLVGKKRDWAVLYGLALKQVSEYPSNEQTSS